MLLFTTSNHLYKTRKQSTISLKMEVGSGLVVHTFNPSTLKGGQADLCEFETNLVYIANYRIDMLHTETKEKQKGNQ